MQLLVERLRNLKKLMINDAEMGGVNVLTQDLFPCNSPRATLKDDC
jgi:hypothetical protein